MNTEVDTDADVFDPFLTLIKSSKYFDEEDVACVEETRKEHQKHVQTRVAMDAALRDTKQFLIQRMHELQEFEKTVSDSTRSSPAYKHFFETFLEKQVVIQNKYKELLEKREAIYGRYIPNVVNVVNVANDVNDNNVENNQQVQTNHQIVSTLGDQPCDDKSESENSSSTSSSTSCPPSPSFRPALVALKS